MSLRLKVICEKSNFQSVIFAIISVTINGHTYILFKNIPKDVQAKGKGEINTALHNYSKIVYFDAISVEGLKVRFFFINSATVFYHQGMKPIFSNNI